MEQEQFIENLESDLREASLAADQSREELCTAHREAGRGREDFEAVMRELEVHACLFYFRNTVHIW